MATIEVEETSREDGWQFAVEVKEDGSISKHTVTVGKDAYDRITGGRCEPGEFVRRAFEFLLEREPRESILSAFDVTEISKYFPDFEEVVKKRL